MVRSETSPKPLSRLRAEVLAARIFRKVPTQTTSGRRSSTSGKPLNRRQAEDLAAQIFGQKKNFKAERRRRRHRNVLAKKRKEQARADPAKQGRCWDWILTSGSVHYARNAAAFTTYTPLSPENSASLGLGLHEAIGIGTVHLGAARAFGGPEVCSLILYDVLHIPLATCNGIAKCLLLDAGAEISMGSENTVVRNRNSQHLLLEARCGWSVHRLCLDGELSPSRPAEDEPKGFTQNHRVVNPIALERLGRATRELRNETYEIGVVLGPEFGLAC